MVFTSETIDEWSRLIYWTLRKYCRDSSTTPDLSRYTNQTGLVHNGTKYSIDGSIGLALLCEDCPESCYIWDAMISLVNRFGSLKGLYDTIQSVRTTLYVNDLSVFSQKLLDGKTPQSDNPFLEDALFVWIGALFGIKIADVGYGVWKNAKSCVPNELLPQTVGKISDSILGNSHTLFADNFTVLSFLSGQYKAEKKRERIPILNSDEVIANLKSICDARCFLDKVLNSSSLKSSFVRYDNGNNQYCLKNCCEMVSFLFDAALVRAERMLDGSIENTVSAVVDIDGEMSVLAYHLQYAFSCLELYDVRSEIMYFNDVAYPSFVERKAVLDSSQQGLVNRAEAMVALLRAFAVITENTTLKKKLIGESNPRTNGIRYGGLVGKLQVVGDDSSGDSNDFRGQVDDLLASIEDILSLKISVIEIATFLNGGVRNPQSAERKYNDLCSRKEAAAFIEDLAEKIKVLEDDIMPLFDGTTECYSFYKTDIETYIRQLKEFTEKANDKALHLPEDTANDVVEINRSDGGHIVKLSDDLRVQFSLLDEDFSELSFTDDEAKNPDLYDYSYYHRLVDATVDVRKQPVFGDLKRINAYPFFKPFSYQVDSVHTMLSRFEGRGVFGDQVGLGKTLQALMTAYTMYQHGAIRNVVVIATRQTLIQWRDNELRVKFRGKDGKCLFDVYPDLGGKSKEFGFDELFETLERHDKVRTGKKPKLYTISVESFKNALPKIKAAIDASDYYNAALAFNKDFSNELRERIAGVLSKGGLISLSDPVVESVIAAVYSQFDFSAETEIGLMQLRSMIEERVDIDSLQLLRLAVLLLASKMSDEQLCYDTASNLIHAVHSDAMSAEAQYIVSMLNDVLASIDNRISAIKTKIDKDAAIDLYRKKRVIDLLVFDEVQELLVASNSSKAGEMDDNVLRQEFIARIPKKYCILLSATPIRSDLSDIFNLMYMVDKNRLGTTRKDAEERFYNAYCGGCHSLSDMANADNPEKQFAKLNGLINTMFTRKRLYDPDVIESISRHTATPEEMEAARIAGRVDEKGIPVDYGGKRFYNLMQCLAVIKNLGDSVSENVLLSLSEQLRKIFDEKDYDDINVVISALKDVVNSIETASMLWRKRRAMEERKQLDEIGNIDVIDDFILSYDALLKKELEDPLCREVHDLRVKCDLDISYINRGMLDFYSSQHDYSTIFLADFLDWRRPYKHGVAMPFESHEEKINVLGDLLVPDAGDDEEFMSRYGKLGITHDELVDIQKSKIVIYDKWTRVRRELYRRIRAEKIDYGEPRKVYIDGITPADKAADSKEKAKGGKKYSDEELEIIGDAQKNGFTPDELVDLEYYPGPTKYTAIHNKPAGSRTRAEKYILNTFKMGGRVSDDEAKLPADQRDRNFSRFKAFSAENDGNWNSIYFFEYTKVAGTDLKAASTLIIGQLDERDQNYMEPLRFEQLIGRISRTGQTERCLVLICLLKGYSDSGKAVSESVMKFNRLYYDLLSDPHGFDLLGACQAEVDFVVPVVMACARRLFSEKWSYHEDEIGDIDSSNSKSAELLLAQSRYDKDQSRFRAVYKSADVPYIAPVGDESNKKDTHVETIPDVLKYAFDYDKKISVVCSGTFDNPDTPTVLTPTEAIKEMVRYYARILSHDAVEDEE